MLTRLEALNRRLLVQIMRQHEIHRVEVALLEGLFQRGECSAAGLGCVGLRLFGVNVNGCRHLDARRMLVDAVQMVAGNGAATDEGEFQSLCHV